MDTEQAIPIKERDVNLLFKGPQSILEKFINMSYDEKQRIKVKFVEIKEQLYRIVYPEDPLDEFLSPLSSVASELVEIKENELFIYFNEINFKEKFPGLMLYGVRIGHKVWITTGEN